MKGWLIRAQIPEVKQYLVKKQRESGRLGFPEVEGGRGAGCVPL